jgi:hypothetical protein
MDTTAASQELESETMGKLRKRSTWRGHRTAFTDSCNHSGVIWEKLSPSPLIVFFVVFNCFFVALVFSVDCHKCMKVRRRLNC